MARKVREGWVPGCAESNALLVAEAMDRLFNDYMVFPNRRDAEIGHDTCGSPGVRRVRVTVIVERIARPKKKNKSSVKKGRENRTKHVH